MRRPLLPVCLCLVMLSAFLHYAGEPFADSPPPGGQVSVTGYIYQKDDTSFYLKIQDAANLSGQKDFNTNLKKNQKTLRKGCRIICESEEKVLLGSVVVLRGEFEAFSGATNPGEFDYADYYHSLGLTGRVRKVEILNRGENYSRVSEMLYSLRNYWKGRLYRIFPEKEASVMAAVLLGDKSGLDEGVRELYRSNGIIHILSISGLHITVIGMGLYRLLRRLGMPVWAAALCGGCVLLLYGIMTGLGVSTCRAIGMYLLRMLALLCGRTYDMLNALGVMAVILVWQNPGYLEHMGFLLSFGSILGVGVLYPALAPTKEELKTGRRKYVEGRLKRLLGQAGKSIGNAAGKGLLASLSVTLTTLPVQLWFSYEVPIYSIFLNVLILPFMGAVMAFGLAAMLVPGLGFLGTADVLILAGYERLCALFESFPFHTWNPGRPGAVQIVLYYIMWLAVVWGTDRYRQMRKRGSRAAILRYPGTVGLGKAAVLAAAVICIGVHIRQADRITFLDVGQGDCICVQLSSGETYLFDCGSTSRSRVGERVLIPFLKYSGIRHVDGLFLSHPDSDHVNGALELLALGGKEHITIGQIVLPGIAPDKREAEWGELLAAVRDASQKSPIAVGYVQAGASLWADEDSPERFLCLHPSAGFPAGEANAYSECFYMELGNGFSILLTGDVEGAGEEALLMELRRQGIGAVTVLKAAHHGSRYSTSAELLEQVEPKLAVISCGRNNSYGHPHREVLERLNDRGILILQTPKSGAVTLYVGNGETRVEEYLKY